MHNLVPIVNALEKDVDVKDMLTGVMKKLMERVNDKLENNGQ